MKHHYIKEWVQNEKQKTNNSSFDLPDSVYRI
jgi:hypothetical protein